MSHSSGMANMLTHHPRASRVGAAMFIAGIAVLGFVARLESVEPAKASADAPEIRLEAGGRGGSRVFEVTGLSSAELKSLAALAVDDARWQERLAVYVVAKQKPGDDRPPMLGKYAVEDGRLRFTPRFPLAPGVRYRAVFNSQPASTPRERQAPAVAPLVAEFELPPPGDQQPTRVTAVYPTGSKLPENQLKFYVHFSAPMSRGEAYEHLRLLDADGEPIDLPFLELGEELWDPSGKRFTLFFDPGRIKRGLKPREEAGPVLESGKTYTLVVDRGWHDAAGRPLAAELRKTFRTVAADETSPNVANWNLTAPHAGTRQPLTVRFPEPLDHALLERLLWVANSDGQNVTGEIAVADQETCWRLTPHDSWQSGNYRLYAETTLEDLAGNSLARTFEVDELKPVTRQVEQETVNVEFSVH